MSERDNLLESVTETIRTYRRNDLPEPTEQHVDRWLRQFTASQQMPFLREFDHVMKETFFTRAKIKKFLRGLTRNEELAGGNPEAFWTSTNFLDIQHNGQSQREMLRIFATCLDDEFGLDIDFCGETDGEYVYLDDIMFSGNRIAHDLESWIEESAPQYAKINIIVAVMHTSGYWYLYDSRLKNAIEESGKDIDIQYWSAVDVENRKWKKDISSVLWPADIPDVPEVLAYMGEPLKYPHELREPGRGAVWPFSSEAGRQVLESEFFIAGAKIRSMSANPKAVIRPLGFSAFGAGFGSMMVTYRNCPNNCPLAMWWGDENATSGALHWYPLLPRETYSSPKNTFNDFFAL